MELIDKVIAAHGRAGTRAFNQIRFSLTLIGPIFIIIGVFGLMGYGTIYSNGMVALGIDQDISFAIFILVGIISTILRLAVFKEKRKTEPNNT